MITFFMLQFLFYTLKVFRLNISIIQGIHASVNQILTDGHTDLFNHHVSRKFVKQYWIFTLDMHIWLILLKIGKRR